MPRSYVRRNYTRELLAPVVAECKAWTEVCRKLGVRPMTGSQTHLARTATKLGIDSSHFLGQASNLGKTFARKDIHTFLCKNGPFINSHALKMRLIRDGLKERKCERCGGTEWLGQPIPIELHHRNRDHEDNRFENLQILCPNCHALENSTGLAEQPDAPALEAGELIS